MTMILCLIGFHKWRWFSLSDPYVAEDYGRVHMSQCDRCRKISGGWK